MKVLIYLFRNTCLIVMASLVLSITYSGELEIAYQTAIRKNDLSTIDKLVGYTDDVDARGTNEKTALMIAAKSGNTNLVEKLLGVGADPNAINSNGGTAIMFAAIYGEPEIISALIEAGASVSSKGSNGWSALMVASAKGHVEATRLIIKAGAEINTTDIYLWTPLLRAAYENRIQVIELLLTQEDITINHRDEHGATALHHAAVLGHADIVNLLIEYGADPRSTDSTGRTPAIYASDSGHYALAERLEDAS